ncbi:MAG: beta-propeller domain-containing protein [Burkholderiales bacterium]|nr:beta-propeller domain-containing protein [Burkholderiales bacterium]
MSTSLLPVFALALFAGALSIADPAAALEQPRKKTLTAFSSEAELRDLFKTMAETMQRNERRSKYAPSGAVGALADAAPQSAPMTAAPSPAPAAGAAKSLAKAEESVTNTQTAGVDEGGIVKLHGNHLVVLRRGRLFTVDINRGNLKPISTVDAYAPDADPAGAWYDEMLVSDNTIVVIGYSYSRGGTEIGLFDIDDGGNLSYRATYHMRSNDYYSSRNYASRLIGSKLVFYTPLYINLWQPDPFASFPAVRKWRPNATATDFKRIAPATRIYRTDEPLDPNMGISLHTVSVCDLAKREMTCEATAVLGPSGRVFYVSGESVYVWTTTQSYIGNEYRSKSGVFRIPLDGKAPSALKVAGSPIDQFSFLESPDRHLNVLVRANGKGDGMWAAERGAGDLALMRVPLDLFSDGRDSAPSSSYKPVPSAGGYALQNRFIGSYLLYGSGAGWGYPKNDARRRVYAVRWDTPDEAQALGLPHGVDRIEALGNNAVVIGSNGKDLHFTSVALDEEAIIAHRYIRENASQGETRSHGFFYKQESGNQGMIGLPIMHGTEPGYRQLRGSSASVLFLREKSLKLSELGSLAAQGGQVNDMCRASCVDWYGNSRPLFLRGRVFALMGYELVEGKVKGEQITETQRINFGPISASIVR